MHPVRRGEAKHKAGHAMRKQGHGLCLLSALALLMGGVLGTLVACTPALLPGQEYELEVPPPVTALPTVIASLVIGNFLNRERAGMGMSGMCRFLRLRTEQEDYEAAW